MEQCKNCARDIGNLDAACVWADHIVCAPCHRLLTMAWEARIVAAQPVLLPAGYTLAPAKPRPRAFRYYKQPGKSRAVAFVLSLVVPGFGQFYCGHVIEGLFWLILAVCGWGCFFVGGPLVHLLSAVIAFLEV